MIGGMSAMEEQGAIPEWTLGWRLARALGYGGVSVEEMAAELGVSRSTVSRWMNDRGAPPRIGYVKLWCQRTGTNLEWVLDWQHAELTPIGVGLSGSTIRPSLTCRNKGALAA
jgi:transcriptional regulator with XRE-family HTH domain